MKRDLVAIQLIKIAMFQKNRGIYLTSKNGVINRSDLITMVGTWIRIYCLKSAKYIQNIPVCLSLLKLTALLLITKVYVVGFHKELYIYNCTKTRYRARIQRGHKWESLGTYDTPEEAFYAYKPVKEAYIKSLAEKWKDQIDPRVYDALVKWEINIDD